MIPLCLCWCQVSSPDPATQQAIALLDTQSSEEILGGHLGSNSRGDTAGFHILLERTSNIMYVVETVLFVVVGCQLTPAALLYSLTEMVFMVPCPSQNRESNETSIRHLFHKVGITLKAASRVAKLPQYCSCSFVHVMYRTMFRGRMRLLDVRKLARY